MSRIHLSVDGVGCAARLYADAPRAVARLLATLPLQARLRQSRWSGNTTFAPVAALDDAFFRAARIGFPAERAATFMCPGRVYVNIAGIGLPYAEAQSRDVGLNTWIIEVGELEGEIGPFISVLRRVRREGSRQLIVSAA